MNIMYINDTGFDSPNSNNHLVLSMLVHFLDEGHSVYYVGSHSVGTFDDIPLELKDKASFSFDIIHKPVIRRNQLVRRYLSAILFEIRARKQWKKKVRKTDIVIVQSHYTAFFTFKFLKKFKKKTVFNIYDIFPGSSFKASGLSSKLVYKFFYNMQQYIYKTVSCIFTLTEDTKSSLLHLGVSEQKIHIIPNWFDNNTICETDSHSFMGKYNLVPDKKYVQYAGQIGISYDFHFIVDVADCLKDRIDIVFEFVGEGLYLEEIKDEVKKRRLNNFVFIPWQPLENLAEVYSSCTIQMVPLKEDIIFNSYPSKILPLMGCKRTAVISVEKDSFFYNEMNSKGTAICVPIDDIQAFKDAIIKLCDDDGYRHSYETRAYNYVLEHHTAYDIIDEMISIFNNLMEE